MSSTEACRQAGGQSSGYTGQAGVDARSTLPCGSSCTPRRLTLAATLALLRGAQDWNYVKAGCFEVTLELWNIKGGCLSAGSGWPGGCAGSAHGCSTMPHASLPRRPLSACSLGWRPSPACKQPTPFPATASAAGSTPTAQRMPAGAANLTKLFSNNLDSMTAYALTSTFGGLRGTVKQRSTGKPLVAKITGALVVIASGLRLLRLGAAGQAKSATAGESAQ